MLVDSLFQPARASRFNSDNGKELLWLAGRREKEKRESTGLSLAICSSSIKSPTLRADALPKASLYGSSLRLASRQEDV
jgi:hypothetical protein